MTVKQVIEDKPLSIFGTVASRVIFQQKKDDTIKVIEKLGQQINNPKCVDLLLLTFNKETNLQEALDLIKIELQSCLYIQRFDFFHKLMILSSW
jgi:hypothetical protein